MTREGTELGTRPARTPGSAGPAASPRRGPGEQPPVLGSVSGDLVRFPGRGLRSPPGTAAVVPSLSDSRLGAARRHLPGAPGGSALSSPTEGRGQDAGEPHPHGRGGSRGCPSCCIPQPSPDAPGAAGGGSPGSEPGWGTAAICSGARGLQAVAAAPCRAASGDSRVTNEVNVPRAGAVTPR